MFNGSYDISTNVFMSYDLCDYDAYVCIHVKTTNVYIFTNYTLNTIYGAL